jgi:hypothetical protein
LIRELFVVRREKKRIKKNKKEERRRMSVPLVLPLEKLVGGFLEALPGF